jgi:flagellar hook-associated protein 2
MVSLINFGGLKDVNGRKVLSGTNSGLDTAGIVDSLANAKRLPAVKFEDDIKLNNSRITALTQMKSTLKKLKEAANALRNPTGFGSAATNAFEARTAFMSMSNGDTASNYVGISANNGTPIGRYQVTVGQIASAQNDSSESFASLTASVVAGDLSGGPTTGKFNAGTFNIGYNDDNGAPQTETITLTAGSNLATVRDAINAKSDTTGVNATIIKYSDTDYRLKLYSEETGEDNAFTFTNGTGSKVNFTTTAAQNAEVYLDGNPTAIERSTNIIDDLIPNATLTVYQETGAETITVDIDKDNTQIATKVSDFLTSYNEFRLFSAQQTEVDENGKAKDTAYLNNNSVMESIRDKIAGFLSGNRGAGLVAPSELSSVTGSTTTTSPVSLANLGIYFSDIDASTDEENPSPAVENVLQVDAAKFNDNLQKYFSKTRELFEYKFTTDNSDVNLFKRSNATYEDDLASYTMTIDHTAKTVSITNMKDSNGVTIGTGSTTMTYDDSGGSIDISGVAGTPFEGMEFFFSGTASGTSTANITMKQGMGDLIFNALDAYVDGIGGDLSTIDAEIENLQTQNKTAQDSIDRIDERITSYRDLMLNKFAALEALIGAANQTLTLLDSQANARNNG